MNENEMNFRTAAFGGFQKQDVLDYLERGAKEHAEKQAELQKRLDDTELMRRTAEETLEERQSEIEKLRKENEQLTADLTEKGKRLAEAEAKVTALTAQVAELSTQVQRLTPGARAYESLKDRAAGIELGAHSRAKEIEAEAQARADETKEEVNGWFVQLQSAYDQMKEKLHAALSQAEGELVKAGENLKQIAGELDTHDSELREMQHSVESVIGPRAPEPLPLTEETGEME